MLRISYLFLEDFEKKFHENGCPYPLAQRVDVEDFLTARFRSGRSTSFTAASAWENLTWWSEEFRNQHEQQIINYSVG
jgi:hypothetical protein